MRNKAFFLGNKFPKYLNFEYISSSLFIIQYFIWKIIYTTNVYTKKGGKKRNGEMDEYRAYREKSYQCVHRISISIHIKDKS